MNCSRADIKWNMAWVEPLQCVASAIRAVYLINPW